MNSPAANVGHNQVPGVKQHLREWGSAARGDGWLRRLCGVAEPWLADQLRDRPAQVESALV